MSIITLTVYLILSVFAFIIYKKISHPVVMFNLIWTVLIAVSRLGLVGLSIPPSSTYEVFLKGGLVFNVFSFILFFISRFINTPNKIERSKTVISDITKQRVVLVLNIILFIYYIYKLIRITGLIGEIGDYTVVRGFYYSTDNFASSLEYNIVTFLFDPIVYLNAVIFALNTKKKHYHTYTLLLMFVNMLLRTVISGGRMIMFEFAACILIVQLTPFFGENERRTSLYKKSKNTRIAFFIILILLFFVASYITELRGGTESTLAGNGMATIISNFTGSFSYFSIMNSYGKYYPVLYGRAMFAGIIDPIIMLLHFFKLTDVEIAQNSVGNILSEFFLLGSRSYNAMPTMYYYFITDFRELGIIIGSVILSAYCFIIDRIRKYYNSFKSFGLYLLMTLVIIESSMTWLPFRTSFIIANFLVLAFVSNNKFNKKKRGQ